MSARNYRSAITKNRRKVLERGALSYAGIVDAALYGENVIKGNAAATPSLPTRT